MTKVLLEVRGLSKTFPITSGIFRRRKIGEIPAVDGVSLSINEGETLALVGESGCGKSTMGRLFLGLLRPSSGQIFYRGKDISYVSDKEMRELRSQFQMIFQDPFGSLNPRMKVLDLIAEPLKISGVSRVRRQERAMILLQNVGLSADHAQRYPHEFSGGQRQRIGIARALALDPQMIVADEPVSALDVSVQAQVINLLQDLQKDLGLTYLFISHDLGVVHHIADRIAVMYLGRIVEIASKRMLSDNPCHPYTKALLDAIPVSHPGRRRDREILLGDLPASREHAFGCRFATRCRFKTDLCMKEEPLLLPIGSGHAVACHHVEQIQIGECSS